MKRSSIPLPRRGRISRTCIENDQAREPSSTNPHLTLLGWTSRRHGWETEARKEGRTEGGREGRKDRRKEGKEGRKAGRNEDRKEGRKEGWLSVAFGFWLTNERAKA